MESSETIWNLSKWRFLQADARLWVFSNKALEIVLLAGIVTWVYFEFFSYGIYENIKYIGLVVAILSVGEARSRLGLYEGYFDGYEQGFKDAATRNCDYWGDTHNEFQDNLALNSVLNEIKNNEEKISHENKQSRLKEIEEGFSRLAGYIFTWRKIN
jgi:hypothetical protein